MILPYIHSFIEKYSLQDTGCIVAFSGGTDSTALLYALKELETVCNLRLTAAHVNYNLRGKDSVRDREFCKNLCRTLSVELCIHEVTTLDETQAGVEERARTIRYDFFSSLQKKYNARSIMLGHNKNDQVETLLFRLVRGTGISGARGMDEMGNRIARPLLRASRKEIVSYLENNNRTWQEDRTNGDSKYSRNLIRNEIIPRFEAINPRAVDNLFRFCSHLNTRDTYNKEEFLHWCKKHIIHETQELIIIQHNRDEILSPSMLNLLFQKLQCSASAEHIEALSRRTGKPRTTLLPDKYAALQYTDRLVLFKIGMLPPETIDPFCIAKEETIFIPPFCTIECRRNTTPPVFDKHNSRVYINAERFPLHVRGTREDDWGIFFGKGNKKVWDILKKNGIPRQLRKGFPLITDKNGSILWIPGHGFSREAHLDTLSEVYILNSTRFL
ncbi:MAG: tRNA lysidine(34) synthetase TilS [Fibrobacterota bacterium]